MNDIAMQPICVVACTASGWHVGWSSDSSVRHSLECLCFKRSRVPSTAHQHQRLHERPLYLPPSHHRRQVRYHLAAISWNSMGPTRTPTSTLGMRLSCNFVTVYTIADRVQYTRTCVHARIPITDNLARIIARRVCRTSWPMTSVSVSVSVSASWNVTDTGRDSQTSLVQFVCVRVCVCVCGLVR